MIHNLAQGSDGSKGGGLHICVHVFVDAHLRLCTHM